MLCHFGTHGVKLRLRNTQSTDSNFQKLKLVRCKTLRNSRTLTTPSLIIRTYVAMNSIFYPEQFCFWILVN